MYPHKWEIGIFNAEWGRKVIREKIKWTYEFTVVFFIACYQMGAAQNKYEIKKKIWPESQAPKTSDNSIWELKRSNYFKVDAKSK